MANTSTLNKDQKPYNAFEHLCSIAFPYNETERVMAFYSAYFDESGVHNSRILTIAGYVATVEQWGEFAREWGELLKNEGVEIFHMKDFENGFGEFKEDKGWTKERKINFQSRLIGIIKRRVNAGIFSSVDLRAYEELITGWRRERNGTPYHFCVKNCIAQLCLWAQQYRREEPIAYIIEHGAGYNNEIEKAFYATFNDEARRKFFRLGSLSFETKEKAIQLQAADLLAYEIWKHECNFRLLPREKWRKRRKSYEKLVWQPITMHIGNFFGRAELERAIEIEESDYSKEFPGGVISFRKPDINTVIISADSSELEELLDELSRLMELSPHLVYPLIDSSASVSKAISINTDNVTATGAENLRVLFKPTDFLLSRMAALRTNQGQGAVSE